MPKKRDFGNSHSRRPNPLNGYEDFSRVIDLLPTSVHAYYYRAVSYHHTGKDEQKRTDLEICLTLTINPFERKHIQKALKGEIAFAFPSAFPDDEQEDEYIDEEDELAEEEED